jgi:hypothetical protein
MRSLWQWLLLAFCLSISINFSSAQDQGTSVTETVVFQDPASVMLGDNIMFALIARGYRPVSDADWERAAKATGFIKEYLAASADDWPFSWQPDSQDWLIADYLHDYQLSCLLVMQNPGDVEMMIDKEFRCAPPPPPAVEEAAKGPITDAEPGFGIGTWYCVSIHGTEQCQHNVADWTIVEAVTVQFTVPFEVTRDPYACTLTIPDHWQGSGQVQFFEAEGNWKWTLVTLVAFQHSQRGDTLHLACPRSDGFIEQATVVVD